jgi:hypothetical protein
MATVIAQPPTVAVATSNARISLAVCPDREKRHGDVVASERVCPIGRRDGAPADGSKPKLTQTITRNTELGSWPIRANGGSIHLMKTARFNW